MALALISRSANRRVRVALVVDDTTGEVTGIAAENDTGSPATVNVVHRGTGRSRSLEVPAGFRGQRDLPDRIAASLSESEEWPDLIFSFSGPSLGG
jgi:hypothetical protein